MTNTALASLPTNVARPACAAKATDAILTPTKLADPAADAPSDAEAALYNGSGEDMADLMEMFKQLVIDPTISDDQKQTRLAELCDLGEEASVELRKVRLQRFAASVASSEAGTGSPASPATPEQASWWSRVFSSTLGVQSPAVEDYAQAHF